jgi:phosphomethylpyrimidine synthase
MKITQDVRDYAESVGVSEEQALTQGMAEKAQEFSQAGLDLYKKL